MDDKCSFQHTLGISKPGGGCSFADDRSVKNLDDIALCMEEAACNITGALLKGETSVDIRSATYVRKISCTCLLLCARI